MFKWVRLGTDFRKRNGGSDPRVATCRGKLQNKRSKLNQEINKELRLRAGAENLFRATNNRKLKETVALELSFVNSNLQLLKEQLAELNSSVELYQNEEKGPIIPLIPLGLKETKEVDFKEPFKDFILEHYSEEGNLYSDVISQVMDLRQAIRTPLRDENGISLLFQYYNQLYFLERRFFPPDRSLGIYFEWYDSLTGIPSYQRTVAFEKACVLFNIAAIYTQIAAKQDRKSISGLNSAIEAFLRSSGTLKYISENFTNAPSTDLNTEMLEMLGHLMQAQAKECFLEKLDLSQESDEDKTIDELLDLAQEGSHVADIYTHVIKLISPVKCFVPYTWISLVTLKVEYYMAMAHRFCGMALMNTEMKNFTADTIERLKRVHYVSDDKLQIDILFPKNEDDNQLLARAHLKESLLKFEETLRLHRMCRELKNKPGLETVLKTYHSLALNLYSKFEEKNDFRDVLEPPQIIPLTKFTFSIKQPDFAQYRVDDMFKKLGPCAVFSAKHHWSAPRLVQLQRTSKKEKFGFTVRGSCPVIVSGVDPHSLADFGGIKEGDYLVSVGDEDVKWYSNDQVTNLLESAGDSLSLKLVTPMNKNNSKVLEGFKCSSVVLDSSQTSNDLSNNRSWTKGIQLIHSSLLSDINLKRLTWNPFKKQNSTGSVLDNSYET
ncbi:Rhophilin-2, putative [Pediculus humanus corporis]|uniref:Rhophilin-2, putative n=1 Tax=Pediculus humanus subsp. corporis TaxID=121224 RepID=E0VH97_PEDHC|nr:Rhophilin-2, putative [Pediculus humanus corporis]EEB12753.1 Rhophilin-2, putative [Pediculus humanus corporis]